MDLDNVLATINDVQVNSNGLAINLFETASTLDTSTIELRRIAIEVSSFSTVLPQLGTTLLSEHTPKPTENVIHTLLRILKQADKVLRSIDEAVVSATGENDNELGNSEHADSVRLLLKSAQMTVHRLSLEALRLALALLNAVLVWSCHWSGLEDSRVANASTEQDELCAKCAVLSLHASIMQLQAIEKLSLNESAARRLSEEREYAAEMLRRIDRRPAQRRRSSTLRHHKEGLASLTSVLLEDVIFSTIQDDLHPTDSWVSQSTEHSLLLRKWTGIDLHVFQVSEGDQSVPMGAFASEAPQTSLAAEAPPSRKLSILEKVAKIRSHSSAQIPKTSDRGRLLSVQ